MNDTAVQARLHTHRTGNPPKRENVFTSAWPLPSSEMGFSLLSSGNIMVHTAPVLPANPLSRSTVGQNTYSQKVTKPNYFRGQRCLASQNASRGKKLDLLNVCRGAGILPNEKEESLSPVCLHDKKLKANH